MSDAARAAEQERETLAGLSEMAALRTAAGPSMPTAPTTIAGLPIPPDLGRRRAEWKASGMTNEEIEDMTAELTGQPVPVRAPKPPALMDERELTEAINRVAVAPPLPIEMTDDELAAAVRAVREAKARVLAAADALQKATAEQTAALDAYEAAKRLVAAGMAALTG